VSVLQLRSDLDAAAALLVEELFDRLQAGGSDVEPFIAAHPEHADALRRLLPAMRLMADLSGPAESGPPTAGADGEAVKQPLGDYQIVREVGRGGMGVVYEAVQLSLGRRVALKVLPLAATLDPRQLQRFKNEAKAAASLRHENIVHVYGVGCERGVHYYAMEFIDGPTLAQVIARRAGSRERPVDAQAAESCHSHGALTRPRSPDAPTAPHAALSTEGSGPGSREFYRTAARLIAEAADALEHAHSLGIVHRDVKPANLLVDAAGKVYVGDFGLARVGPDAGLTMTGDLLGTLRYMAPEQALARHGLVDHRADVYALGATLYELLTGRPAVGAADRADILRQIAFEDPTPPRKLDKAIPAELETVTLKALAKHPAERYAAAGELADDLHRWLGHKTIKAKRPTLRQRAVKWARRHRPIVGATAVVLLLALAAAGAFGWRELRQQAETERQVELALQEATIFQGEAKWPEALAAVKRAEVLLDSRGGGGMLRRRSHDLRRDLDMISACEEIRLRAKGIPTGSSVYGAFDFDLDEANADYHKAFRAYGIDLEALDPPRAGELVRGRAIRQELIAALDHWARLLTRETEKKETWKRLLRVARQADSHDWRNRVRLAVEQGDVDALTALARTDQVKTLPPSTLGLFADALRWRGAPREALDLLREVQRRHPGDYWINADLARMHQHVGLSENGDEAVRFYTAALAARPQSPNAHLRLGWALMKQGCLDEAVPLFQEAVRLRPDYANAHNILGMGLMRTGLPDEAIAEFREAIRLRPDYEMAHMKLGTALADKGRLDEAIAAYQEAIRLDPDFTEAHNNLGQTERWIALGARLPRLFTGEDQPADTAERLALAWHCQMFHKQLYAAAARWYAEAFAAEPQLASDPSAGHYRYSAACAAANAARGQGQDSKGLDENERARLRRQALDWLTADLVVRAELADNAAARPRLRRTLQHWQQNPDLADVRDAAALTKLPEAERAAWQKLWAGVTQLLERTTAPKARDGPGPGP
jgi:serine/threonine protein kinase/Tfp pilus assembly protein PilF